MSYFILFDTEYTSWEGSQERNWSYDYEYKEIICISALKIKNINNELTIIDKFNYYVKPIKNPLLSNYITNLTGITQNTIDTMSIKFEEALKLFYIFCENYNIYSYGNDYHEIKINITLNKLTHLSKFLEWEKKFYDIKPIFQKYNIDTNKYTSGTVYKSVNLQPSKLIKVHDSIWDTYSLFITLKYLLNKYSNKNYIQYL